MKMYDLSDKQRVAFSEHLSQWMEDPAPVVEHLY